jgi:hypothetical protein
MGLLNSNLAKKLRKTLIFTVLCQNNLISGEIVPHFVIFFKN